MIGKGLALALVLLAFPVQAEEPPAPAVPAAPAAGVPLSLADATIRALAHNNDIALERESFRIADASILRADGSYDPTFHLDAHYRNHTDPANSLLSGAPYGEISPSSEGYAGAAAIGALLPTGGTVSVSAYGARDLTNNFLVLLSPGYTTSLGIDFRQPLLQNLSIDPARRAIRIAALDKERGTASLRTTVSDVVAVVERAYWNLVAARRDVLVREASMKLAAEQREDTKSRIDVGTLPESDIAQPIAEYERRRGDLYASQENMRRAELALKLLLLDDAADPLWNQTLEPTDKAETPIVRTDLAAALAQAEAKRPEIADTRARVAQSDVDVEFTRNRLRPQLDLVAGYAPARSRGRPESECPGDGIPRRACRRARRAGRRLRPFVRDGRRRPLPRRLDRPLPHRARLQPDREGRRRDREGPEEPGRDPPLPPEAARRRRGPQRDPHARHRRAAHRRGEGGTLRRRDAARRREGALRRRVCRRTSSS